MGYTNTATNLFAGCSGFATGDRDLTQDSNARTLFLCEYMPISNGLLDYYKALRPELQRVYIVPDIHVMARNDPYPYELYRDVLAAEKEQLLRITTAKILPFSLLVRRWLGERSIVHHHFFEVRDASSLLNVLWKTLLLTLYRMAGGTIVWTIHNAYPHERKMMFLVRPLRKYIARVSTSLHVHCRAAVGIMSEILDIPAEKFVVIPHPLYPAVAMEKSAARRTLAEKYSLPAFPHDRPVLLMLGSIARYKGIDGVLRLLAAMDAPPVLVVAGSVKRHNEAYMEEIHALAQRVPTAHIVPQRIPHDDMPLFYHAADYALFNYTDILTSGGVAWAMSYRKPIIAPHKGCLCELGGRNVQIFATEEELTRILQQLKNPDEET